MNQPQNYLYTILKCEFEVRWLINFTNQEDSNSNGKYKIFHQQIGKKCGKNFFLKKRGRGKLIKNAIIRWNMVFQIVIVIFNKSHCIICNKATFINETRKKITVKNMTENLDCINNDFTDPTHNV